MLANVRGIKPPLAFVPCLFVYCHPNPLTETEKYAATRAAFAPKRRSPGGHGRPPYPP